MEDRTVNNEQDIKDYLSIIYGENIKVIFNNYVFTWEDTKKPYKNGYILGINGAKLIKEKIDDVIELIDSSSTQTIGYVVFLKGQLKNFYSVKESVTEKIMVISDKLSLDRAKIQVRYYSKQRPDMVIAYNLKKYIGKFDENGVLKYFISPS